MSTTFFCYIDVGVPRSETGRVKRVLRKSANTFMFDAWLPWTHREREHRSVILFTRHEVGLAAGAGAQREQAVALRFAQAIRQAFGTDIEVTVHVLNLDRAPWYCLDESNDPLVQTAQAVAD